MSDIIIAIDPGRRTGICKLNNGEIELLKTVDHTEARNVIRELSKPGDTAAIEVSRSRHIYMRKGANERVMRRIASNVGENRAMARELCGFCEGLGLNVIELEPRGTKITAEVFKNLTGYKGRTSSHARDAWVLAMRAVPN